MARAQIRNLPFPPPYRTGSPSPISGARTRFGLSSFGAMCILIHYLVLRLRRPAKPVRCPGVHRSRGASATKLRSIYRAPVTRYPSTHAARDRRQDRLLSPPSRLRVAGIAVSQKLFRVMLSLVAEGKATRRSAARRVKPHCLGGPRHLSRAECVAMNAQKSS